MIKFGYIGEDVLDLSESFGRVGSTSLSQITDKKVFLKAPVLYVDSKPSRRRVTIVAKGGSKIVVDSSADCLLIPIENGYLAGSYVLAETDNETSEEGTTLYVISDNKILTLAENIPGKVALEDIDKYVSNKYVVSKVARALNHFDVSQATQWYEIILGDLPQSCVGHPEFKRDVLSVFKKLGDLEISANIDPAYINSDLCKARAEQFLSSVCDNARVDTLEK